MINLKQSVFCKTCSLKILVLERKYKTNLKNRESQNIYIFQLFIYICNVYLVFYYEIQWCYQDFKSEYLCFLNLYSVRTARIQDLWLEVMLSPPK